MKPVCIVVNDLMQQGDVYFLTEPIGRKFHPDPHPELTPNEMLVLGRFLCISGTADSVLSMGPFWMRRVIGRGVASNVDA